jgi:invasion protein IalB
MRVIPLFAAFALAACQPGVTQSLLEEGARISADIQRSTLASGWTVRCAEDHHRAERRCYAGKFGKIAGMEGPPFQVYYVNKVGPKIIAGFDDFPGMMATVRVDNGRVIPVSNPGAIIDALRSGRTAYVIYYSWPKGEERMTVDVAGFAEALQLLQSMI